MADIEAFERVPLPERHLPMSTYEVPTSKKNPPGPLTYLFNPDFSRQI